MILKSILKNGSSVFAAVLLLCSGCAVSGSDAPRTKALWSCDQRADAAVHREDWTDARKRHLSLLEGDPGNCLAQYHMGYILGRLGDRKKEVDHYELAVACGYAADDRLFFNLGMAYIDLQQASSALGAFQRAVALNPEFADSHFGMGLAAASLGRTGDAIEAFNTAVDLDPQQLPARLELVRLLLDANRLNECRRHLAHLMRAAPGDPQVAELNRRYADRQATAYDHQTP